jgi:hypothetical protein
MSIHFKSSAPFAIKVWIGGINAISGGRRVESQKEAYERTNVPQHQDYIVVPEQKWLDGGCVDSGLVRQFVATPVGSQ